MSFPPPTEKQARILWVSLTAFAIALLVAILAMLVWGLGWVLKLLSPVLWPLAIAGVIAYLLDPVVDFLEQKKVSRARAILLVFCAGLVLMGALIASVVPRLVRETSDLVAAVPGYTRQIQIKVMEWTSKSPSWAKLFPKPPPPPIDTDTNIIPTAIGPPAVA